MVDLVPNCLANNFFSQKTAKMRPKTKIRDHHAIFTDLRDLDKKRRGGA